MLYMPKRFTVALSFPGEYRDYVKRIADLLADEFGQECVLYDAWYKAEFTRNDLDTYLQNLYQNESGLLVPFLCAEYESKRWCKLEWRAIRELMQTMPSGMIMPLRFDQTQIPGVFGLDGSLDLNKHEPEQVAALIIQRVSLNQEQSLVAVNKTGSIKADELGLAKNTDRLPTVKGEFFGREKELCLLSDAWHPDSRTNIIQFVAPGGTGKTKLLSYWLDQTSDSDSLIVWSFYSQGAGEDKQTSSTPFFSYIFKKLQATQIRFDSDEEQGEYLADLLCQQRCVLVLDGLEPMQYSDIANRGEIKDRSLKALLKCLSRRNSGLCVITSRVAVYELSDKVHVVEHELQNLVLSDAILLLRSLGVQGSAENIGQAARDYGCHALALSLLGNVLRMRYQGDVRSKDMIKALPVKAKGSKESRHAFKVMMAYEEWFEGEPELTLLNLMGLFDHPISHEELKVLRDAGIPGLTAEIDEDDWLEAIAGLREDHRLLSQSNKRGELDCHPLIREYFGGRLKENSLDTWLAAHKCLYEYYKGQPEKELPDTLVEMQPLFSAVAHGCIAGLQTQVWDEVFWSRIQRKDFYLWRTLGAFSDNLALISHFFEQPWEFPSDNLDEAKQVTILNWAGFSLKARGRLSEALQPVQTNVDIHLRQSSWDNAALNADILSDIYLSLGNISKAEKFSQLSIECADKSGVMFRRVYTRARFALVLHLSSNHKPAHTHLKKAQKILKMSGNKSHRISLLDFALCTFLISKGKVSEAIEISKVYLKYAKKNNHLSDLALYQYVAGVSYLEGKKYETSGKWLDKAVISFREAGDQTRLPCGLLARAALNRKLSKYEFALRDLVEVFDIAESGEMRLNLTDYHLEMARLILAKSTRHSEVGIHLDKAAKLIETTGYHRRDTDLRLLKDQLNS